MADPLTQMATIDAIARALMNDLPDGWREVSARYRTTAPYAELGVTVTGPDGRSGRLDPVPDDLDEDFEDLREQMYQSGKGAWFTAQLTVTADGHFTTDFNYDDEPEWSIPVTPGTYAADLDQYPREDQYIPDWLREKLSQA